MAAGTRHLRAVGNVPHRYGVASARTTGDEAVAMTERLCARARLVARLSGKRCGDTTEYNFSRIWYSVVDVPLAVYLFRNNVALTALEYARQTASHQVRLVRANTEQRGVIVTPSIARGCRVRDASMAGGAIIGYRNVDHAIHVTRSEEFTRIHPCNRCVAQAAVVDLRVRRGWRHAVTIRAAQRANVRPFWRQLLGVADTVTPGLRAGSRLHIISRIAALALSDAGEHDVNTASVEVPWFGGSLRHSMALAAIQAATQRRD